jgi:pyruvate/2-oxoglutarate dehydrogenase complex dihydrolipoamide acyltransferase (E2) component
MANKQHSISSLARRRWNIVDLITIFGRPALPVYLICDLDMTWAENLRTVMNEQGHNITVTAILLKAIALAQRAHPLSRGIILPWGRISILEEIVAGFTVERLVGGEPAVFLGTIHQPDTKSIEEIAKELNAYATKDLSEMPQLEIEDRFSRMPWLLRRIFLFLSLCVPAVRLKYLGATFGLSSLGKLGVQAAMGPCICTSTFGIGSVENRAKVHQGALMVRPMVTITLGADTRVMSAGSAALFLEDVRRLIESAFGDQRHAAHSTDRPAALESY